MRFDELFRPLKQLTMASTRSPKKPAPGEARVRIKRRILMKHKKFTVWVINKTATPQLKTTTPQGGIQKSFDSKEEAIKFAENNKRPYNKITIKCPNEPDIVYG